MVPKHGLRLLIALAFIPAAAAAARIERSSPSSATVTWRGKERDFLTRTSQLLPFVVRDAATQRYRTRLVTVQTRARSATDLDGVDGRVSVLVEDLDRSPPRPLARFSDPGASGSLLDTADPPLFVTLLPLGLRVVRRVETGGVLFHATGEGEAGMSAWFYVQGAGFDSTRWAALETEAGQGRLPGAAAAILRFGDRNGVIQRLQFGGGDGPNAALELGRQLDMGRLLWDDPTAERPGLQAGDPDLRAALLPGQHPAKPEDVGGFSLVLRVPEPRAGGAAARVLARIPVRAGRLQPREAELAPGYTLTETADLSP